MPTSPYLWDKGAPRDAFVAGLEQRLAPVRARIRAAGRRRSPTRRPVRARRTVLAVAALLVMSADWHSGRVAVQPSRRTPPVAVGAPPPRQTESAPAVVGAEPRRDGEVGTDATDGAPAVDGAEPSGGAR